MHSGKPCLGILNNPSEWLPGTTITGLLVILQQLLVQPNLEDPVNAAAGDIYVKSQRLYEQLARDCVVASRRLIAGMSPYLEENPKNDVETIPDASVKTIISPVMHSEMNDPPKVARLSFDDYHNYWKTMATSIPVDAELQQKTGIIFLEGQSLRAKLNEKQFREMVERQKVLWYGKFDKPHSRKRHTPQSRLQLWKQSDVESTTKTIASETNTLPQVFVETPMDDVAMGADTGSNSASVEIKKLDEETQGSQGGESGEYFEGDEEEMEWDENGDDENWEQEALELEQWSSALEVDEVES
ncbi:Ubiquitin-conjugating enzyme E2 U [Phlyctochytrium planicorne]|nr:Ubiquitin-conjugating enzyme E2 U [Phlyctochytrium planicorne]